MKRLICISVLCLALSACAADTQSSSGEAVTTTTTTVAADSSKPDDSTAPKPAEKMGITAEVLSYEKGTLTFKYEDKEYSLPFSRWNFDNDSFYTSYPSLSESIINNKYGETVYAKMSVAKDMSKIFKCDVVKPNGEEYDGEYNRYTDENGKDHINTDLLYSFKRKEGTLCEISNVNETLEFDLNDLPMNLKFDYPEVIDLITFHSYRFKDGKTILLQIFFNVNVVEVDTDKDEAGVLSNMSQDDLEKFGGQYGFYGVIQSVSEGGDKITFLLNDKKTLCTVPTYYGDGGELKEGMEIMVRLKSDVSLFGSGGEHEFDYAVIHTEPEYYNQTGENNQYSIESMMSSFEPTASFSFVDHIDFDDLAYAKASLSLILEHTTVKKAEKQDEEG